jgi:hypothetical protein
MPPPPPPPLLLQSSHSGTPCCLFTPSSLLPPPLAHLQIGADVIELGVPYSDPLADGPVIQAAATRALQQGATLDKVCGRGRGRGACVCGVGAVGWGGRAGSRAGTPLHWL